MTRSRLTISFLRIVLVVLGLTSGLRIFAVLVFVAGIDHATIRFRD